jgi:hypothetical protein
MHVFCGSVVSVFAMYALTDPISMMHAAGLLVRAPAFGVALLRLGARVEHFARSADAPQPTSRGLPR